MTKFVIAFFLVAAVSNVFYIIGEKVGKQAVYDQCKENGIIIDGTFALLCVAGEISSVAPQKKKEELI